MNMETPLAKLARIMSKEFGLQVRFQGAEAWVNLQTKEMNLPSVGNTEIVDLLNGYLDHESAHVRFTSSTYRYPVENPLVESLMRVLEDVRVDWEMGRLFLGCIHNIGKTRNDVYKHCVEKAREFRASADALFWMDILENLAGRMHFDEMCEKAKYGVFTALDLFMKLGDTKTTEEVEKLARQIAKRWESIDPPPNSGSGGAESKDKTSSKSGKAGKAGKGKKGKAEKKEKAESDPSMKQPWEKDEEKEADGDGSGRGKGKAGEGKGGKEADGDKGKGIGVGESGDSDEPIESFGAGVANSTGSGAIIASDVPRSVVKWRKKMFGSRLGRLLVF